jgi:site-specific DNA-methyltransferase (adenine-specific)
MGTSYAPTNGAGQPGYGNAGSIFGEHRFLEPGHTLQCSSANAQTWSGWGTNLKPAHEPIVLARKKFKRSVARNVQEHGTGALNIDECRVGKAGRWPTNFITDGSEEVEALLPNVQTSAGGKRRKDSGSVNTYGNGIGDKAGVTSIGYAERGSAMRFFYCAKASRKDRNDGLEDVERNGRKTGRNDHATVKPYDLMAYLCRLITPVGGKVLDPFMGSGSTGKAALLQGFGFIGIERDPHSFDIACARIAAIQGIK